MLKLLREEGYFAFRTPGSLGVCDVIALRGDGTLPRMVEVKSTARGPYAGFPPKDREELRAAAKLAGARAELAWWPPRGKLTWIPAYLWPV